jgi:hypothetical protein
MVAEPPTPPEGIPAQLPPEAIPESGLRKLQGDWSRALARLIAGWPDVVAPLNSSAVDQVLQAAMSADLIAIGQISLNSTDLAAWIETELLDLANLAAERAADDADRQDVEVAPGTPDRHLMSSVAQVSAATLAAGIVLSASREAARVWRNRHARAGEVADAVAAHLESLTTAQPEYVLGGALSGGQREGRASTARRGPGQALYASEILDTATCKYCRAVDRRWLGNSDDPAEPWLLTYPSRGYVDCLGRDRCRGQVVYVWRGGRDWRKWIEKEAWP